MQIVINISKSHALILSTLLFIIVIGIAADYATSAATLTQWHPLSEIAVDGIPIESTTSPGKINASYIEGGGGGQWAESGSDIYYSTGNVGIGTSSPGAKLDVQGGTIKWGYSILNIDQDGSIELGNSLSSGKMPYIDFHYGTGAAQDYNTRIINDANNRLSIFAPMLYTSGNVGIGTTDPGTSKLKVTGTIESTSGGIKFPDGNVQTKAATGITTVTDVTVSRADNAVYQNTYGKDMWVFAWTNGGVNGGIKGYIGPTNPPTIQITNQQDGYAIQGQDAGFLVPSSYYYKVDFGDNSPMVKWIEMY